MEGFALLGKDEAEIVQGCAVRGGGEVERRALVLDQLSHHVQPATVDVSKAIPTQQLMPATRYTRNGWCQ